MKLQSESGDQCMVTLILKVTLNTKIMMQKTLKYN